MHVHTVAHRDFSAPYRHFGIHAEVTLAGYGRAFAGGKTRRQAHHASGIVRSITDPPRGSVPQPPRQHCRNFSGSFGSRRSPLLAASSRGAACKGGQGPAAVPRKLTLRPSVYPVSTGMQRAWVGRQYPRSVNRRRSS